MDYTSIRISKPLKSRLNQARAAAGFKPRETERFIGWLIDHVPPVDVAEMAGRINEIDRRLSELENSVKQAQEL